MYDGNVYESIMRWVEQLPINRKAGTTQGTHPGWELSARRILKTRNEESAELQQWHVVAVMVCS